MAHQILEFNAKSPKINTQPYKGLYISDPDQFSLDLRRATVGLRPKVDWSMELKEFNPYGNWENESESE